MASRLVGFALFLPVPLVLWLITARPLGLFASLGLGGLLVATHRLYARPWALARSERRCLWCGGEAATPLALALALEEPFGTTRWAACSEGHCARLCASLGWASARGVFVRVGILGSLVALVALAVAAPFVPSILPSDGPAVFRLGVALTVLPLGWLGPRATAGTPGPLPFPVHIQALIGTFAVSWLFRLVGLVWLALGVWHFVLRFA